MVHRVQYKVGQLVHQNNHSIHHICPISNSGRLKLFSSTTYPVISGDEHIFGSQPLKVISS